jgi:iron complex transport system ATP-binding protein
MTRPVSLLTCVALDVSLGGRPVLRDVHLGFESGTVTAVLGPNGAGKSTLLSCLAGLMRPSSGAVRLDDAPLSDMAARARARRIAVLPQTPEIAWPVEARALVGLGRTPFIGARGLTTEDEAAVDRALAAAGATSLAHRTVDTLSGGERARVLIARALAGEPDWLLADEPMTGLDPAHQLDAVGLFRSMAEAGVGVIVTLHDLSLALRIADRIVVLADGAVIGDGPVATALTPDLIATAYGIRAEVRPGRDGPVIEVLGRL